IVNQTKIDNVDRNFRVVTLPKLIPDIFLRNFAVCCPGGLLSLLRLRFFKPQSIKILLRDSRQTLVRCDRVAATQALGDYSLTPAGIVVFCPLGIWIASQSRLNVNSVFSYIALRPSLLLCHK